MLILIVGNDRVTIGMGMSILDPGIIEEVFERGS